MKKFKKVYISTAALGVLVLGMGSVSALGAEISQPAVLISPAEPVVFKTDFTEKQLLDELKDKFKEEGTAIFNEFKKELINVTKQDSENAEPLTYGYQVKVNNENVLAITITEFTVEYESPLISRTYTADKKSKGIIKLSSMFKDNSYIDTISKNIIDQMHNISKNDENKTFFIAAEEEIGWGFSEIKADNDFYINDNGNIVIFFDKYEVAPGYMGTNEFIIPTEIIKTSLNSDLVK